MQAGPSDSSTLLERALASGRIHSAYLLSGEPESARAAAQRFARGVACTAAEARPCEECSACRRSAGSSAEQSVEIDPSGKTGPLFRHIGDHPDLFWIDRGADSTRVRIGQIRALQASLRLGANEGGWRAAVIADAEWLHVSAQNALLRLLEEPPDRTTIILVASSAAGLLATIRSRTQRVLFRSPDPVPLHSAEAPEELRALALRLDGLRAARFGEILDWAEEFRGERARAARGVHDLLATGSQWLRENAARRIEEDATAAPPELAAFKALSGCRKDLDQRNANPQMVAERALLALREAASQ
jgi:hypothetical protein